MQKLALWRWIQWQKGGWGEIKPIFHYQDRKVIAEGLLNDHYPTAYK